MADFTDVAQALVTAIAAAVYPNGTGSPSIAPGNAAVKAYQGWPIVEKLEADLKAGKVHITVFPTPTEHVLPLRMPDWQVLSINTPTISLAISGNTVTVSGAGAAGQNAAVLVDGGAYVYAVQAGDTPTSIATALAIKINAVRPASSVGAVVTIPNPRSLIARVGVQGTSIRELRRQEKLFQISVWANCFDKRDPVASKVDIALAGIARLTFADGSQGILRYRSSVQNDGLQKSGIYRRDLLYAVEYATTETSIDTQIVTEQVGISPQLNGAPISQVIINL